MILSIGDTVRIRNSLILRYLGGMVSYWLEFPNLLLFYVVDSPNKV